MSDKRVLRKIAKRYAKGVLLSQEALVAFWGAGLDEEQISEIQEELTRIADRITEEDPVGDTHALVDEYFE